MVCADPKYSYLMPESIHNTLKLQLEHLTRDFKCRRTAEMHAFLIKTMQHTFLEAKRSF